MLPRRGGPEGSTGTNAAVTLLAEVTLVSVQVAPVQSPLHPANWKPALGVAVQVVVPPWPTGLGEQLTVPPLAGFAAVVTVYEITVKFAVTLLAEVTPVRT